MLDAGVFDRVAAEPRIRISGLSIGSGSSSPDRPVVLLQVHLFGLDLCPGPDELNSLDDHLLPFVHPGLEHDQSLIAIKRLDDTAATLS